MTGEPTHIASKERMAPEAMFLSERVSHLSITNSKVKWPLRFAYTYFHPVLQTKNKSIISASAINPVATENTDNSNMQT